MSRGFWYTIFTLDNAEVRDAIKGTGYIEGKGQNEILVIYSTGFELSKFQ